MYSKRFNELGITNVTLSHWSPRKSGETSANSNWVEVKLVPCTEDRVGQIAELAKSHSEIWLRVSTRGGHARLFVSK